MNEEFWKEELAAQRMQAGLFLAVAGEYVSPEDGSDPLLARIDRVCLLVQKERQRLTTARSLVNPSPSRSAQINAEKVELAQELDTLLRELAASASLVAEVLRVYSFDTPAGAQDATRGMMDTPNLTPPVAEVRRFQQALDDRSLSPMTIPPGSPVTTYLQAWQTLLDHLQELYAGMDELSSSTAFVMRQENAEAVDALLADDAFPEEAAEVLEQVLTLHDLSSGEVQVLQLTGLQVEGRDWIVRFAAQSEPLPLLARGEILRVVSVDGSLAEDIAHQDLEFQESALHIVGVEPQSLEVLGRLAVHDIQQLALLHYGHKL
ncbi:hypothetical protein [Deinococcus sp. QL22]|uniref:hypothetical protein n=1 Tax=Deinococcus sp. QL22 TaxID=2939437 RepID=UPI002017E33A|nr:hypothetical protein [Deinococcus sp. QL22]UQN08803.1 hypothetical protein M1R55_19545 [Deinococcus sp. QL22]